MSEVMHNDASDVSAVLAGNADAFARIYDRHAAVVLSLCRGSLIGRSLAQADDAMQETFIRAYKRLDQLDQPSQLRPWLYGIARHVCSEYRRATTRRNKYESRAMNQAVIANPMVSANGSADLADREEQLQRLSAALDQLDEQQQLAIHLYYLQDDAATVAMEALNMSRSGFYKLLARARERLAQLMQPSPPETSKETLV